MKTFSVSWLTFCNPRIQWDGTSEGMDSLREELIAMSAQGRSGFSICITSFVHCFAEDQ